MSDTKINTLQSPVGANISMLGKRPITRVHNNVRQYNTNPNVVLGHDTVWENGKQIAKPYHPVKLQTNRGIITNSVLRKDEWQALDTAVLLSATSPMKGIARLVELGLLQQYNSLGVQVSQYNRAGQMTAAAVTMDGASRGDRDALDYDLVNTPLPIVHKEYSFTERTLLSSRLLGAGLDVSHASAAAKVVGEQIEGFLFTGYPTLNVNGGTIYGFTTEPNRNTGSATGDWGTISNIMPTVLTMIAAAEGDNYYGPYELFIPTTQYNEAAETYTDGSGDTAIARMLKDERIAKVHQVPEEFLTAGSIVLVKMAREVVDLAFVNGFGITVGGDMMTEVQGAVNLEWTSGDGMNHFFKVAAVMTPRVKSDKDGNSGVVHFTGA